uniref:Uncharacterized protein n=1 Tax=Heterorhabditis bacteriophora TaxID=37862 RepID=A0A1I7WF34_HETBA
MSLRHDENMICCHSVFLLHMEEFIHLFEKKIDLMFVLFYCGLEVKYLRT